MANKIDMQGTTWGLLTVLREAERDVSRRVKWECRCVCGTQVRVAGGKLRSGHTRSCGQRCLDRPAIERFAEKIALAESGCIEWIGGLSDVGYGQFYVGRSVNPRTGKGYAHRWSYEHHVGPIPAGLHLDHLCRNRRCVNPEHLEPVTLVENVMRGEGSSAKNARKTHCPQGHEYAGANLYVYPMKNMRRCRECGRQQQLAARQQKKAS